MNQAKNLSVSMLAATELDRICISKLELMLRIGTTAEERLHPQRITLSIELAVDLNSAGRSNQLADSVDYAAVASHIVSFASEREWILLENLAHEVSQLLIQNYPRAAAVGLEVRKYVIPDTSYVAIKTWRVR